MFVVGLQKQDALRRAAQAVDLGAGGRRSGHGSGVGGLALGFRKRGANARLLVLLRRDLVRVDVFVAVRLLVDLDHNAQLHEALAAHEPLPSVLEHGFVRLREGDLEHDAREAVPRAAVVAAELEGRVGLFLDSVDMLAAAGYERGVGFAEHQDVRAGNQHDGAAFGVGHPRGGGRCLLLEQNQEREQCVMDETRHTGNGQDVRLGVPGVSEQRSAQNWPSREERSLTGRRGPGNGAESTGSGAHAGKRQTPTVRLKEGDR